MPISYQSTFQQLLHRTEDLYILNILHSIFKVMRGNLKANNMPPGKISLRFDGDIKGFYRQAKN